MRRSRKGRGGRGAGEPDRFGATRAGRGSRKDLQLCHQVRQALELALASSPDEVLEDLWVVDVAPAPDVSRLMVTVEGPADRDVDAVLARLEAHAATLRHEVADSIHRRRTPSLIYRVAPAGTWAELERDDP
ncbi:MAG: ribosome-binding factor A [Sandaracinaceae bacterium]